MEQLNHEDPKNPPGKYGRLPRGLPIVPWTINEEADLQRMLALGVDGINTDYPDRLLELLP